MRANLVYFSILIFEAVSKDEQYMKRCLQLAGLGNGYVAPNPMVGAVLVYQDEIIGEGYHQKYGGAHAEVNCINSVPQHKRRLVSQSTLYVSLEPCAHFGKTPPCADLIIAHHIPRVVIGCPDSFEKVNGKGIQKLVEAGISVTSGVLENAARQLNRAFFTFHQQQRPYIILKWAQTTNGNIANPDYSPIQIGNPFSTRLVHRLRSQVAAIMVASNTALHDNPSLTTRYWKGNNPLRILLDKHLVVPATHQLLADGNATMVFNYIKNGQDGAVTFYRLDERLAVIPQLLNQLFLLGIQTVLVEGGAKLLQSFLDSGIWDEAAVINNNHLLVEPGIVAPVLKNSQLVHTAAYLADTIQYYQPSSKFNS
jgi:diaminohydroxyphosphoribosylaminopyrimidine deaminase / 5-amino-6-(5-phosphoribosylamino)uracil reductase